MVAGVKNDESKVRIQSVLGHLTRSLTAVCEVGAMGNRKYSPGSWVHVPDGVERYTDAMLRHWMAEQVGGVDRESGLLHAAHCATNALIRLDLILREAEKSGSENVG